jgi:hypothetical protein
MFIHKCRLKVVRMLFKKDKRKEYMKLIGIKYGKDEMKEIKSILKTDMPLNAFKMCITPMIDEKKLNQITKSNINGQNISIMNALVPLKADQIKEIRKGIDNKLSLNEVELYKIPQLDAKNMKNVRESLERRNLYYKKDDYGNIISTDIEKETRRISVVRNAILKYRDKELGAILKLQELNNDDTKFLGTTEKEEFEKIYKNIPKDYKKNIIITEDLAEKIDLKILNDLKRNNARIYIEWMDSPDTIYKPNKIKEDYEYIRRKDLEYFEEKSKDSDGDGLTDIEEKNIYFTKETSRDSDGDGKSDYEEVKNKTNPRENNKRKKKEKELER